MSILCNAEQPASVDNPYKLSLKIENKQNRCIVLKIAEISDACLQFIGLSKEECAEGVSIVDCLPNDRQVIDEWMELVVTSQSVFTNVTEDVAHQPIVRTFLQFFHTTSRWVTTTLEFLPDSALLFLRFESIQEDVPNIALPTWMSIKQKTWLNDFMDTAGHWRIHLVNQTIYLSRKISLLLQLGDDAMVIPLDEFFALIHPDDRALIRAALANVETMKQSVTNKSVPLADGSIVYVNSYGIPGYDVNGIMTHIVGCSQDVTPRQKGLNDLFVTERRFRSVVEYSQDLYYTLDANKKFVFISASEEDNFGHVTNEFIGKSYNSFLATPEDLLLADESFDYVWANKTRKEVELNVLSIDGSMKICDVRISAVTNHEGDTVEVIVCMRDITKEKKYYANLLHTNTHDALTKVYNRYFFEQEMSRIDQEQLRNFGLIMVDINGLKLINDAFGHLQGDTLLQQIADLLCDLSNDHYDVFRIGGDEFAILFYNCIKAQVESMVDKIKEVCMNASTKMLPLSISCGLAHRSKATPSVPDLFKEAEGSMFNSKLLNSKSMHSQIISSLEEALKVRHGETAEHMHRIKTMVTALGNQLNLPSNKLDRLMLLASMHDIGKLVIPDHVIGKPGPLSEEEWVIMKTHSELGSRLALSSKELSGIAQDIACHHEKWDGTGYPYGYRGENIPQLSRIISIVDTYDVMTHKRVYKSAVEHEVAIKELVRCAGSQFDPEIVALFVKIFGKYTQEEMQAHLESFS